ncbi:hypothetical protein [Dehalobacter sp. 4CP]|uniref:hypothetical protein n=1 Tax=Dehalobacter sp. CP TaxID=2594474 RepID=UPI0039EBAF74
MILHFPEYDRAIITAVGIRHVKHIAQVGAAPAVVDKGDALGALVHPPAQFLVPYLNRSAGGRIGTLGVNQQLVLEGVLVVPSRRLQEVCPVKRSFDDI